TAIYTLSLHDALPIYNLQKRVLNFLPLSDENIRLISKESSEVVKSNAIGIPLVAFLQGIVALIGYYIFGVQDPIFWFVVTVIGSDRKSTRLNSSHVKI